MKHHITEDPGNYVSFHYGVTVSFIALRADNSNKWHLNRSHITGHGTMELELVGIYNHIDEVRTAVGEQLVQIMTRKLEHNVG